MLVLGWRQFYCGPPGSSPTVGPVTGSLGSMGGEGA